MSAVLRASGRDFDVDAFLVGCTLPVCGAYSRGEPVFLDGQPDGPTQEESGINVMVSEASFEKLPRQIEDAIVFLRAHGEQVRRLCEFRGVEGVSLDFGVVRRDLPMQCDYLPADLIRLTGALGLAIELSQYPGKSEVEADGSPTASS